MRVAHRELLGTEGVRTRTGLGTDGDTDTSTGKVRGGSVEYITLGNDRKRKGEGETGEGRGHGHGVLTSQTRTRLTTRGDVIAVLEYSREGERERRGEECASRLHCTICSRMEHSGTLGGVHGRD